MSQAQILEIFFQYLTLLAPLVVAFLFVSIMFGWIKKLADVLSGKGW